MIGGTVIGIVRKKEIATTLHVRDHHCTDQICVKVKEERSKGCGTVLISIGDQVWWQGNMVLWTPFYSKKKRCGQDHDIAIPKIGYTYSFSHAIPGEP
jgi:hypothetical protein